MKHIATQKRSAFTLVELLVTMGIIVALAALTAAFVSTGAIDSQRLISSADRTSGWLVIAKNRALRDQAPRGVRFFINGNSVTEAQYIEVPEPWVPNPTLNENEGRIVFIQEADTTTGVVDPSKYRAYYVASSFGEFDQRVKAGSSLYLSDFGQSYQLTVDPTASNVTIGNPASSQPARLLTLSSYPRFNAASSTSPQGTLVTYQFGFQSSARPLLGETPLEIPAGTVIDWRNGPSPTLPSTTSTTINVKDQGGYFDILFAPSGQVLNNSNGYIALWIRDPEKNGNTNPRLPDDATGYDQAGEQVLIVVYTRGGYVSTQPVAPGTKPHLYLTSGINTGTGF